MSIRLRSALVLLMGSLVLLSVQAATQATESQGNPLVETTRWSDEDVAAVAPAPPMDAQCCSAAAHPDTGGTTKPSDQGSPSSAANLRERRPSAAAGGFATSSGSSQSASRSAQPNLQSWANALAPRVGIPHVALAAYGAAELQMARDRPGCHLSWVALAGIGSVESDHGRHGGAALLADGTATRRVIGVALNGVGVGHVGDTDGGALDGDPASDHAVGPMQFIPRTWATWAVDGNGDGSADPFSIPDAALAAGRYLCAAGAGDLRLPVPWTRAVWAYNHSDAYVGLVTRRSNAYALASRATAP